MIAAPSLPPHNRGSLAGARPAPAPSPRAPPRVVFLLLLAPPIRFAVAGHLSRVPGGSARRPLCLSFLLASFLLPAVCPPVGLGRFGFVCPCPALSRKLVRWRVAGRSPLRGFLRLLPPPAAALWVGRVGFPPCRSARSARPLALLPRHSGLPLRGCFCPAVAGLVSFSPFRPPPASSLRCGCVLRASRGTRSLVWRSLVCVPSPPI